VSKMSSWFGTKGVRTVLASWLSICAVNAGATESDSNTPAPDVNTRKHVFTFDLQYAEVSGYVQVREFALEGTRLALDDLGIDHAVVVALGYEQRLSEVSSLRFRLRWYDESGKSSFPDEIDFNGAIYQAGATLTSTAQLADFLFHWQRDLLRFGHGGRFQGLVGVNFTYLNFTIDGPQVSSADPSEGFYQQALPLPSLGLRVYYPIRKKGTFYAEVFGFAVNNWNSLRMEGGTVTLSQDNAEANIGVRYQIGRRWQLDGGLRYDYLYIDEESTEDGNVFLQRSWGPFIGFATRF
jgi:hypothetical protein